LSYQKYKQTKNNRSLIPTSLYHNSGHLTPLLTSKKTIVQAVVFRTF